MQKVNQRESFRSMINAEVELTKNKTQCTYGTCVDISSFGIGVLVLEPFFKNDLVSIKIQGINKFSEIFKAKTYVANCIKQSDGTYKLGLKIIS